MDGENSERTRTARAYLDLSSLVLLGLGIDGQVRFINPRGADLLGYPENEIIGRDWIEIFVPMSARNVVRANFQSIANGTQKGPNRFENPILCRDGSEKQIVWQNAVSCDPSGRVVLVIASGQDVTEQRHAEAAWRESEARFRATFEQAAFGLSHVALDGTILRGNQKLCDISGYTREELQGLNIRDVTHPEDIEADLAQAAKLVAGEIDHYVLEKRLIRKDKSIAWISATRSLGSDGPGGVQYFVTAIEDISLRKEADALLRSERLQRMALSGAQTGVWEWDTSTGAEVWSPEVYAIFGLDPSKGPLTYRDWLERCVHPEDWPIWTEAVQSALAHEGGHLECDYRAIVEDRGIRWLKTLGRVIFDAQGKPKRVYGLTFDATNGRNGQAELQAREARFRLAFQAGGIGVWDLDVSSGELTCSDNLSQRLGFGPKTHGSLEAMLSLVHPDDLGNLREIRERALADQGPYDVEFRIVAPSGGFHWVAERGMVLKDPSGKPIRMIGTALDITQRKEAEERQLMVSRELDHRTNNILALVQVIASQTFAAGPDLWVFTGRLAALAQAHSLLTANQGRSVDLMELIRLELSAYPEHRIQVDGPSLDLSPKAAQTLAFAFHELATNAAKYGALSGVTGCVSVQWSINQRRKSWLSLNWIEEGGPPVTQPKRKGFGTELIPSSIMAGLGGVVKLNFRRTGLHARLRIPINELTPAAQN